MEDKISLAGIIKVLKKRWKLIIFMILVSGIISGSITYFLFTPIYQASTQILVNQKNTENQLDLTQLRNNIDLINTYSVIIKSPAILEKAIENHNLGQSVEQLNSKISVNSQENSQVFSITVTDMDAGKAVEMANRVSETFQKEIKGIMNVDNVSILAKAELEGSQTPVNFDPFSKITGAVIFGALVGIGLAFILEYLDNTLKNGHDVERNLELPVLGSIQLIPKNQGKKIASTLKTGGQSLETSIEK